MRELFGGESIVAGNFEPGSQPIPLFPIKIGAFGGEHAASDDGQQFLLKSDDPITSPATLILTGNPKRRRRLANLKVETDLERKLTRIVEIQPGFRVRNGP